MRILDGEDASDIAVSTSNTLKPMFDWRQLQRWNISENRLPAKSEIRFRPPGMWDQYRVQILAAVAALVVQTLLICWLVYEHRRRSLAEVQSRNSMAELTYINRRATASELSASIAHEVNQPLSGITMRASAALRWLAAETPDINKARAALTQIVEAGHRASDIVTSIRAMFRKDSTEIARIDINNLIRTVLDIVRIDLHRKHIEIRTELNGALPIVLGDKVQLQQVVLNLVMNASEAMQSVPRRVLTVRSEQSKPGKVHVSIKDTRTGIDPSSLSSIFKPLFTTKANGMGMGLSICHSIIQNHGGRIWGSPGADGGSIFEFELPTQPVNEVETSKIPPSAAVARDNPAELV
jgi:C4-dicarboxylate-specific signal transduction histidine kinase